MHLADLLARASTRPTAQPVWEPDASPASPLPLLAAWLEAAIDDGALAVNTAVLATADGVPNARVVLLADLGEEGARFATGSRSPAGVELAANPAAMLVLHLREHARQIRIAGLVRREDAGTSAAAFLRRSPAARAVTLAGDQSSPMSTDAAALVCAAAGRIDRDPGLVDPDYAAYLLEPASIEFWQSRPGAFEAGGGEQRLRYDRAADGWRRTRLWP